MGQQLFAGSLVETRPRAAAAVPMSMAVHVMVVGGLLALPLIGGGELPPVPAPPSWVPIIALTLPARPVTAIRPAPPRSAAVRARPDRAPALSRADEPATTPVPVRFDAAPPTGPVDDAPPCVGCALSTAADVGTPAGGGPGDGRDGGGGNGSTPLVVGGHVRAPAKLRHVDPEYPDLARRAGVQGTVEIECVIDSSGRVASARVVRGLPLLDAAALAAVQRWTYRPTLLNGVAVPVVMAVKVQFHLR
jgi:protein TonB